MTKAEKISHGNEAAWEKKRQTFLKSKPKCSICHEKITHYTETGMCPKCRAAYNLVIFKKNNPTYFKKYNHELYMKNKKEIK